MAKRKPSNVVDFDSFKKRHTATLKVRRAMYRQNDDLKFVAEMMFCARKWALQDPVKNQEGIGLVLNRAIEVLGGVQ